ncbi:carboxypeptidase-like regulatory domain-containing protein [Pedobacter africanus]|uniref:CarboxypepD_reg-like domain-containing protein n=1 Tax=Pedobacter africanus TaxID=151894 RepID=A0A1W2B3B1_9SPHI|nr:carboxypeptidase-like regulatory domain-containing protein [Pedobacter africanus]SMC67429.1 CarboxypepD_reg-like domain-containing protein [Pedobacter africanus]
MDVKRLFLIFYLLFSTSLLSAQTSISGLVKDSIGDPVAGASVTIVDKDGAGIVFEKTDQKGIFNCRYQNSSTELSIKITALGYQQSIVPLAGGPDEKYVITLKKVARQLQEVVIKSNSKILLSSDTLKYSVKAFTDKNDRVIADLIGRLPGIQVDEKGAISYNGKRIDNVYIDGDNLLSGKYRLATNNVPVGAVEQVQVIERDQPIKALNGYVVANNVSLNLKLTDSARTMTINTGYIGLGNKAYSAELNNLIFQQKLKGINNLKTNNIGENLETENADIGLSVNGNEINLRSPKPYISMQNETLPAVAEQYYLMNNDNAANINTLFKFKTDWSLRLNISTLQLKRKNRFNNLLNYFLPGADTISYDEAQNSTFKLNQWQVQAQIEKNSNSIYLRSVTRADLPKWDRIGNTAQNGQSFKQNQPSSYSSLSNETNLVKALGVNNILQYNSLLQYYKLNEALTILPGIQENVVNDSIGYLKLDQQVRTRNVFINQSVTYKTKFDQFILSGALGISYEWNTLNSGLYKTDSSQVTRPVGTQFNNDIAFNNLSFFGKVSAIYLFEKGSSLSIEASPTYSFIHYTGQKPPASGKNAWFLPKPIVEFRKKIGKYAESNFRFSRQTEFGQVNDIYPGTMLVNYRQFNLNDAPLPKTDISSMGLRYAYRKPLKMLFYNLGFNYDRTKQNFINAYTLDSGLTRSVAIDFKNRADRYALNANLSKYLFFLSVNVSASGNLSLQKGNSFYNGQISPYHSYIINLSGSVRRKVFSKATVSVTADAGKFINEQKISGGAVTKNSTDFEKIKAEWQHNLNEQLLYGVSYKFSWYKQSLQNPVANHFIDFNVIYTPAKWRSYFELNGINLINQGVYKQVFSNSNQLSVFQMPLRARMFLLKYAFTF